MNHQSIQPYLQKNAEKTEPLKTVAIYERIHQFYKETALFYNVDMSLLVSNILVAWMEENKTQVVTDRIKKIQERGF